MSERDEPTKAGGRRKRRRSLRVPVDEVPRPTQAGDRDGQLAAIDGGMTMEMPAIDDESLAFDARQTVEEEPERDSFDDLAPPEGLVSPDPIDDLAPPGVFDDGPLLGASRGEDADTSELEASSTLVRGSPYESMRDVSSEGPALTLDEAHSDFAYDDAPDDPALEDTREIAAPAAEVAPVPVSKTLVIVSRVVAVASTPSSSEPPPPLPSDESEAAADLAVDLDLEEPELTMADAAGAEVEDLDVDLEEGQERRAPGVDDEAPDDLLQDEEGDPAAEASSDLLEEEEAAGADADGTATSKKKASKPPPPPPKNKADAPTPPPKKIEARAEPPKAAPQPKPQKRKPKRDWWEQLFNDDYLRTVPIPHPRTTLAQCEFIVQRLRLPPGATILDVGCGLGLHAVELTRRGYLVVGLDLSLPMLSRAADEAQDHGFKINFLHGDMREMNFDGAFDAVLCWGTTFGYFDDDTNRLVVERLHRALKPRGLLLLDVSNRDFVVRSQPNLVWFEGDGCVVMEETQMNYFTSRLEVKRTVILDDGRQRDNLYSLRLYSLHELGQILHHRGFRVVEVTGWEAHPGVFFGADSPKLIILAERRPAGPPVPPKGSKSEEAPPLDRSAETEHDPDEDDTPITALPHVAGEPTEAVSAALAEALEQSGELDAPVRPARTAEEEELGDDDLLDDERTKP